MRILVVEDDPPTARLVQENLEDSELGSPRVDHVSTLAEADAALGRGRYDVVLMDLGLPDSRGLPTLHSIRRDRSEMAVVVLTGLDDPDTATQAIHEGADDYLVKGRIDPYNLSRAISHAVDRRRAYREELRLIETMQLIGESLTSELDLDAVVERATREATELTGSDYGLFRFEAEDEEGRRTIRAVAAGVPECGPDELRCLAEHPLFDLNWYRHGPVRHDDLTGLEDWEEIQPAVPRPARLLVVPIATHHGRVPGCLFLARSGGSPYTSRDERVAAGVASWAAVGIRNARLFDERDRAVAFRDRILASVSHDLRTPLGTISAIGEILSNAGDPEQVRAFAERIRRSCTRMDRLISDLLDLASLEAGQLRIDRSPSSLESLAREAIESVRPAADGKRIRLEFEAEDGLPALSVDPVRILQVLENLLGNAVKFTPEGGRVQLAVRNRDGRLRLSVRDNGPGIARDRLARLFDRFYRSPDSDQAGFGLGLAICKGIVDAHGAGLEVESREGDGATFSVIFEVEEPVSR